MSQFKEFISPRMVGSRFDNHLIPLEYLKDLAVLEQFIFDLAKYLYLQDNPERQRITRGFNKNISLSLSSVLPGSAVPVIKISYPDEQNSSLFPVDNLIYFEKAKLCIIDSINAAANDESITGYIPEEFLGYFEKLGRNLRDDESIEFTPNNPTSKCRFDKSIRRKIIFSSTKQEIITEEVEIRGSVLDVNFERKTFKIKLSSGTNLYLDLNDNIQEDVILAGKQHPKTKLLIKGIGEFNRANKLIGFSEIENISLLDNLDIFVQIEELAELQPGWFNGKGQQFQEHDLKWFGEKFYNLYDPALPLPRLYPTPDGTIQAEWSTDNYEVSLEINLSDQTSEYQSVNINTTNSDDLSLNLQHVDAWKKLNNKLKIIYGIINEE